MCVRPGLPTREMPILWGQMGAGHPAGRARPVATTASIDWFPESESVAADPFDQRSRYDDVRGVLRIPWSTG